MFAAAPPIFLATLKDATINEGMPFELTADINATAEPVEAAWEKDNIPVDTKAKGVTSEGQRKLSIDSCSVADTGEYSVTVKNPSGSARSSAKITVSKWPR